MSGKEVRKKIVETLRQKQPMTFDELYEAVGVKDSLVLMAEINHLQFLGVVQTERTFRNTYYVLRG